MIAATSGHAGEGVSLLSVYSLGLGVPFLISGLLFHHFLIAFNRFRKHIRLIEIITGVMLMAVGIMLMFDLMGELTMYLYQWFPLQN
jgi:cytochrome c-type biogenesis protein